MVRSVWIAAVVVGLAWTGLAEAQSSAPAGSAIAERYITVREEGKLPQRCKLLKSWREANGVPAFQVQVVDSGELMTIVGSGPPAEGGNPRALSTRIFHWGSDNKPPAGAPLPPTQAAAPRPTPIIASQPIRPTPQPSAPISTVRKPELPLPPVAVTPPVVSTQMPRLPAVAPPAPSAVTSKPVPLTPMSTQVIQPAPARTANVPVTPAQPRLVPSANGTVAGQTPCDACCPSPCDSCGKPCDPCCPSCVCSTPSPLRQSFLSRLFKSNACCPCPCTETVCQPAASPAPAPTPKPAAPAAPAPAVAKAAIEPAKPRDWRESWGKVEPWKATAQANSDKPAEVVSRRAAPTPVQIDVPSQPDPLKAPEMYRGMAMSARPANSKIPEESAAAPAPRPKHRLFASKRPAEPKPPAAGMEALAGAAAPASPNVPPPTQGGGRAIQLPANEANAFWTPPEPPAQTPPPKFNAFDRDANSPPPQGIPPAMARGPQMPMPPRGPMPMMSPPMPPMPPMMANTGVPDAMGNAFTLAGTRRPIPADFGGTPQESNGFGDAVPQMQGGQGLPPRAYQMGMPAMPGMPGMPRPQMPNMMAMGANPLMSVPPTLVAPGGAVAAARSAGVPQLLTTLKDSLYPSQREWAAEQLSEMNWRMQPQVVNHLMTSAQADPAPTVRAACVHALAHMKVGTPEAAALVTNLKSDRDPRVRQEAEEALGTFGVPGNPPSDSGIQPASHR